ncbi:MAG TPA: hypothetical protein VGP63_19100 [Planctomycetaceae bacterium]|nr:hypothetical protein [Planctomycetaceae bacterium]
MRNNAIKPISKDRFDSFHRDPGAIFDADSSERSWFANEAETLIGAVFLEKGVGDWGYVLLRADDGKFRFHGIEDSFATQDQAEMFLKIRMSGTAT